MGFGTELLFAVVLGFLILGPKRMHAVMGQVARAKTEFQKFSADFKTQLSADLKAAPEEREGMQSRSSAESGPLERIGY